MTCCHSCRKELDIDAKVGRSETCPFCDSDLHVCYNCRFYSPSSYNECGEPQAERVVDKDRRNFCEYFSFADTAPAEQAQEARPDARDRLESLFKK